MQHLLWLRRHWRGPDGAHSAPRASARLPQYFLCQELGPDFPSAQVRASYAESRVLLNICDPDLRMWATCEISPLWGSSPRPYAYEAHALPTELRRRMFGVRAKLVGARAHAIPAYGLSLAAIY